MNQIGDYSSELLQLRDSGARVFLVQGEMFDVQNILTSAKNLGLLTSDYAFVLDNEYDHDTVIASNVRYNITKDPPELMGIFQVGAWIDEGNKYFNDLSTTWDKLFSPNTIISSTCPSYASGVKISPGIVGCFNNTDIWVGGTLGVYKRLGNRVPKLKATVFDGVSCLQTLVDIFDFNIKNNITKFENILDRQASVLKGKTLINLYRNNISSLINTGKNPKRDLNFDKNGDQIKLVSIYNYKFDKQLQATLPFKVGFWTPDGSISLTEDYAFIGGTKLPPVPPAPEEGYFI